MAHANRNRKDYKARITWEYRRGDEDGLIGSVNEAWFGTWAQARIWIEKQIPARSVMDSRDPDLELDAVCLDELGEFADAEGEPCESRRIAVYEHGSREWSWAED